jgi:hypothetical protein
MLVKKILGRAARNNFQVDDSEQKYYNGLTIIIIYQ